MKKLLDFNGFGRIGRAVTRIAADKEFSLEAINTSSPNQTNWHIR